MPRRHNPHVKAPEDRWRKVPGFPLYAVNAQAVFMNTDTGHFIIPINTPRRWVVTLYAGGRRYTRSVGKIMYEVWPEVRMKGGRVSMEDV
jgi:hypothetical protein